MSNSSSPSNFSSLTGKIHWRSYEAMNFANGLYVNSLNQDVHKNIAMLC